MAQTDSKIGINGWKRRPGKAKVKKMKSRRIAGLFMGNHVFGTKNIGFYIATGFPVYVCKDTGIYPTKIYPFQGIF